MATAAQKKKATEAAAKAAAAADKKAKAEEATADKATDTAPSADPGKADEGEGSGDGQGEALQNASVASVAPAESAKVTKAAPKGKAGTTISVVAAKGLARFFRCGMQFGPEPVDLVVADLEEGVLQRLRDEPRLVVTEG